MNLICPAGGERGLQLVGTGSCSLGQQVALLESYRDVNAACGEISSQAASQNCTHTYFSEAWS